MLTRPADSDLVAERLWLGGLLHALSSPIVDPPVIEAADGVAMNPTWGEVHPAVGAPGVDQVGLARFATVQGVVHAHDAHRLGVPGRQVVGVVHRLPEGAHIPARQGIGSCMKEIGMTGAVAAVYLCGHITPMWTLPLAGRGLELLSD